MQPSNPNSMIVATDVANPAGEPNPFLSIGHSAKVTYTFVDPVTGKQQQETKNFMVTGIMKETGNPQIDNSVIINLQAGNSLLQKSGKYDSLYVIAKSTDFVDVVLKEILGLYGNNIGTNTVKVILQNNTAIYRRIQCFSYKHWNCCFGCGCSRSHHHTLHLGYRKNKRNWYYEGYWCAEQTHIITISGRGFIDWSFWSNNRIIDWSWIWIWFKFYDGNRWWRWWRPTWRWRWWSGPRWWRPRWRSGGQSHGSHTVPIYQADGMIRVWLISVGSLLLLQVYCQQ